MSVLVSNGMATLRAPSAVEDAEPLWRFLQAERAAGRVASVDLSEAGLPHGAVLQLLFLYRPHVQGGVDHPFAARWVLPLLRGTDGGGSETSPG